MTTRREAVREAFAQPAWYLNRRSYNIAIRVETVQEFLRGRKFSRVLDVACGDGSASIPLLQGIQGLTLLDMSAGMLEVAGRKIPAALQGKVRFINDDFLRADLEPGSFDLIICLGLIAHVDSPGDVIARIASLLAPGGIVVMESSDAGNFLNSITVAHHRILEVLGRMRYELKLTTRHDVIGMFEAQDLRLRAIYRYSLPAVLPALERVIPQKMLYHLIHIVYGSARRNRNAWLGKECLYLFESPGPSAPATEERKEVSAETLN